MADKLALIDKDLLMRLISKNTPVLPPPNPVLKEMNRIDNEFESTLQNSNTPDRIKSQKLNELLFKHDNYHKQYDSQQVLPPPSIIPPDVWTLRTVNTAPVKNKKITEALMEHIKSSNKLSWDSQGRLVIDGTTLQNTNILDLVHGVTRRRLKTKAPEGSSEFINALQNLNTPHELVPNIEFLQNATRGSKAKLPQTPLTSFGVPSGVSSGVSRTPLTPLGRPARGRGLPSPYLKKLRSANVKSTPRRKIRRETTGETSRYATPHGSRETSPVRWERL